MKPLLQTVFAYAILLFTSAEMYAQPKIVGQQQIFDTFLYNNGTGALSYTGPNSETSFRIAVTDAKGSQFYDHEFRNAVISDSKNVFKVRYNAFLDEMEILNGNEIYFLKKEAQDENVTFLSKDVAFKVLKQQTDEQIRLGYFAIVSEESNIALYRKDRKEYIRSRRSGYDPHARFKNARTRFFVEMNNSGKAVALPSNKKDLARLFPKKQSEILAYIKEEKISTRNEEDLVKLVNYIASL